MVKFLAVFIIGISIFLLEIGCASREIEPPAELIEIILPAELFEEEDIGHIIAAANEEKDVSMVKENDDYFILRMTKDVHDEMMEELEASLLDFIQEIKTNQVYVSIIDLTHNSSYSEFILVVDKEDFEGGIDGIAVFGLGILGMYYQMFSGAPVDDVMVTVIIKDFGTGEIFDTLVYPDVLGF